MPELQENQLNDLSRAEHLMGIMTERRKLILSFLVAPQSTRQITSNLFNDRWSKETIINELNFLQREGLIRKLPSKAERGSAMWIREDIAIPTLVESISKLVNSTFTPTFPSLVDPNQERSLFQTITGLVRARKSIAESVTSVAMVMWNVFLRSEALSFEQTPEPPVEMHTKQELKAAIIFFERFLDLLKRLYSDETYWSTTNAGRHMTFGFDRDDLSHQEIYAQLHNEWLRWKDSFIQGQSWGASIKFSDRKTP